VSNSNVLLFVGTFLAGAAPDPDLDASPAAVAPARGGARMSLVVGFFRFWWYEERRSG